MYYNSNLEGLENDSKRSYEAARRLSFNKRLIGKKIFSISHGGWYGIVKDMGYNIDEFMVERPNGKVFPVNIHDIRQIDDIMDRTTTTKQDDLTLD